MQFYCICKKYNNSSKIFYHGLGRFDIIQDKETFEKAISSLLVGKYGNELGSTMIIEWVKQDELTFGGVYSTGAGRPTKEELFKFSGTFRPVST